MFFDYVGGEVLEEFVVIEELMVGELIEGVELIW